MVKIPLSRDEIEWLLAWRDEHKDLVRAAVIPFPDCSIMSDNGMKITVKDKSLDFVKLYSFTVTDTRERQVVGRFTMNKTMRAICHESPRMTHDDMQSAVTVWASVMAYIVNHQPEEIERDMESQTGKNPTKKGKQNQKKYEPQQRVIYLKRFVYSDPPASPGHRKYTKPDHEVSVRGHYRHYKSGKVIYVQPFERYADKKPDSKAKVLKMNLEV